MNLCKANPTCPTDSRLKASTTQHKKNNVDGRTYWPTACATSRKRLQGRSQTSSYMCAKWIMTLGQAGWIGQGKFRVIMLVTGASGLECRLALQHTPARHTQGPPKPTLPTSTSHLKALRQASTMQQRTTSTVSVAATVAHIAAGKPSHGSFIQGLSQAQDKLQTAAAMGRNRV
jgi:hypothetical protein